MNKDVPTYLRSLIFRDRIGDRGQKEKRNTAYILCVQDNIKAIKERRKKN